MVYIDGPGRRLEMTKNILVIIVVCLGGLVLTGLSDLLAYSLSTDIGILFLAGGVFLSVGLYIYGNFWRTRGTDEEE